jgi:hypothetical protein
MNDEVALAKTAIPDMTAGLFNHIVRHIAQQLLLFQEIDSLQWAATACYVFYRHRYGGRSGL